MAPDLSVTLMIGSLRRNSFSAIVADGLRNVAPDGVRFQTVDIGAMPHYNADNDGGDTVPPAVARGRSQIAGCDLVAIVTPEYNHSIPGVLKNAIDWLSRPGYASCLTNKPVIFVSQSPSPLGGVRSQSHLREIMASTLSELPIMREIVVTQVIAKIRDGVLVDQATLEFMRESLAGVIKQVHLRANLPKAHAVATR